MVVGVIASRRAVIAEQGWNGFVAVCGIGQQADRLFIRLAGHHVVLGDVAVMAAQAEQNAANSVVPLLMLAGRTSEYFPLSPTEW